MLPPLIVSNNVVLPFAVDVALIVNIQFINEELPPVWVATLRNLPVLNETEMLTDFREEFAIEFWRKKIVEVEGVEIWRLTLTD